MGWVVNDAAMPRYKLAIAYDGTGFCGWQRQEPAASFGPGGAERPLAVEGEAGVGGEVRAGVNGGAMFTPAYSTQTPLMESVREGRVALRTVQGVVEQAVRGVVRERVEVMGASRTDSGVHARGQVAAFTCSPRDLVEAMLGEGGESLPDVPAIKGMGWPLERGVDKLVLALNSRLPADILVLRAEAVGPAFDPIGDVTSKGYSYTFHVGRERALWDRHLVHHVWSDRGLDVEAMNEAAAMLVGEHDFAAFAAAGHGRLSTVRTVHACRVVRVAGDVLGGEGARDMKRVRIEISGSGFLWNMVRIIAGTLMLIGLGQRAPSSVREAILSGDRRKAGPTLGPEGLCLEWIRYGDGDALVDNAG